MSTFFPGFFKAPIQWLGEKIINFILNVDSSYNIDVADAAFSNSECMNLLREVGKMYHSTPELDRDQFKVFVHDKLVKSEVVYTSNLGEFVNSLVDFCCQNSSDLTVNRNAIKAILSSINLDFSESTLKINKSETIPVFELKEKKLGVLVLTIKGTQSKVESCCSNGAEMNIEIKKTFLIFESSKDFLTHLRILSGKLKNEK